MKGVRIVVVGASSGIGRAIAERAAGLGASVVASARRGERLAELKACTPIVADVQSKADCERLGREATDALGQIDLVVYAAGTSPLRLLADLDEDEWTSVLGTNLIGAHQTVRSLLPALSGRAVVSFISSDSIDAPRPGLVPYAASKGALESLIRGFRTEHPSTRFTCCTIGPTYPTEFADNFDLEGIGPILEHWSRLGMATDLPAMTTESVADVAVNTLTLLLGHPTVSIDHVLLQPVAAEKATH